MSDWREPRFHEASKVHDWRNYISEGVRSLWPTFNEEQAKAIQEQAQDVADQEEWD